MSAPAFALTSPSLTDMSDDLNRREAIARFYDAEQRGDAALAAWARTYAPPLIAFAESAPTEQEVAEAAEEAHGEANSALASEIDELLREAGPGFDRIAGLRTKLEALATKAEAA